MKNEVYNCQEQVVNKLILNQNTRHVEADNRLRRSGKRRVSCFSVIINICKKRTNSCYTLKRIILRRKIKFN